MSPQVQSIVAAIAAGKLSAPDRSAIVDAIGRWKWIRLAGRQPRRKGPETPEPGPLTTTDVRMSARELDALYARFGHGVDRAMHFAREWQALHDRGMTSLSRDHYVAVNMAKETTAR